MRALHWGVAMDVITSKNVDASIGPAKKHLQDDPKLDGAPECPLFLRCINSGALKLPEGSKGQAGDKIAALVGAGAHERPARQYQSSRDRLRWQLPLKQLEIAEQRNEPKMSRYVLRLDMLQIAVQHGAAKGCEKTKRSHGSRRGAGGRHRRVLRRQARQEHSTRSMRPPPSSRASCPGPIGPQTPAPKSVRRGARLTKLRPRSKFLNGARGPG
jgi:hypothetical protein